MALNKVFCEKIKEDMVFTFEKNNANYFFLIKDKGESIAVAAKRSSRFCGA